ncbi:MAG: hypothetical protein E7337_04065 [Clostridiales bacterium]|nr:hypothetical protein [Clostridiales bacterium]
MKRISRRDLQNMYEPVPQALEDEISSIMTSLEDGEERPIVKKKISVSFILAAVLIIASMAAVAAGNMNLFWRMTHMAEPILPLEGAEEMIKTDLGSVENEYVRLTVEEAIYDGKGVMTLVRITPKDTEKYAMLNAFMQNMPEDIYDTQICAVEVAQGTQGIEMDGIYYEIINEEDEKAFRINGEDVEITTSQEEAEKLDMPVYIENGTMYETNVFDFKVIGRKDGKETIDWWLNTIIVDENAENAEELGEGYKSSHSMDAEEQPDGSVLVWSDRTANAALEDTVEVKVRAAVTVDGQKYALEDLVFDLEKCEAERSFSLIPEDGKINDRIEVLAAEISMSKVRGYLDVEYTYESAEDEEMGVFFRLRDAAGNLVADGSGWTEEMGSNRYHEQVEVQSFAEIPDTLILEVKAIDGDVLGQCVCKVVEN